MWGGTCLHHHPIKGSQRWGGLSKLNAKNMFLYDLGPLALFLHAFLWFEEISLYTKILKSLIRPLRAL